MSWRIFYEYILWYGTLVPLYIGKWHLDPTFIRRLLRWNPIPFTAGVYRDLGQLVERGASLGFMDCHRADQFGRGYTTWRAFDDYLENAKFEPQQVNIYRSAAKTYRRALVYYAKLRLRGFGLAAASPAALKRSIWLFGLSLGMSILGVQHRRRHRAWPKNRRVAAMRAAFVNYRYSRTLAPWPSAKGVMRPGGMTDAPGVFSSLVSDAGEPVTASRVRSGPVYESR
jgi:hypothetical protein